MRDVRDVRDVESHSSFFGYLLLVGQGRNCRVQVTRWPGTYFGASTGLHYTPPVDKLGEPGKQAKVG
jgi:hypothetical protein